MKKGDYVLIILLVVLSIASFFWMKETPVQKENKYVSVRIDGEECKRIEFTPETVGKTYRIVSSYGVNVVEMEEDRVHVIEASCPDKLDVKQGYISRPGEMIICLPNHLTVEIRENTEDVLDAVSR